MKVLVITRHAPINYGSLLQAIATQKIFESLGHECKIIDYLRVDEEYGNVERTALFNKRKWNKNPFQRAIYLMIRVPASKYAGRKFGAMQKKYLNLTRRYSSAEELKNEMEIADYYVTGSDQVWGKVVCGEYDTSYFLDFIDDDDKKIAFASSMGHSVDSENVKQMFIKYLSRYKKIAVREDTAVDYLKSIGIEAKQVLDPTLMISGDEWRKMITHKPAGKYVLIYQVHNDKKIGAYAKQYAAKRGLPLIRISQNFHQIIREGKLKYLPDAGEFLGLIDNADCLITDSFHGTAFAINLNTDFVEILPNTNTGSRNQSILRLLGLSYRIVSDMNDFSLIGKTIDYTEVNAKLCEERKKSYQILNEFIE
ncbi:polysaccharide pyruvyl transferase family protein [Butyrivibrio sp. WCD2001]|uniref:polysaccharide pyruvyl transferase family protein n=1 Tax=Butyrivibrio sp. WCD2001 TaxID=1280681 RepID=UPI00042299D8|nr:polysaccharide pyruvyl transferase family protein [Butyrivibrio sp. WCD2001]